MYSYCMHTSILTECSEPEIGAVNENTYPAYLVGEDPRQDRGKANEPTATQQDDHADTDPSRNIIDNY